jgi:hypothetical protein
MIIEWRTIPHRKQRYETVGDYFLAGNRWRISTSKMEDPRHERLVFLHEVIELSLVIDAGIKIKDIDKFDRMYEGTREAGLKYTDCGCEHYQEPGDDPHAPYHAQHVAASKCERLIAEALGVKWSDYAAGLEQPGKRGALSKVRTEKDS